MTAETDSRASTDNPTDPIHIDGQDELDDLVSGGGVVLVDFFADWCGPCKMIEPIVADLAAETDAVVAKVDVDANQPLAAEYGVRGVPTLVLFDGGEQVRELVGAQSEETLRSLVESHTGN